jgi:hypothetical protein
MDAKLNVAAEAIAGSTAPAWLYDALPQARFSVLLHHPRC